MTSGGGFGATSRAAQAYATFSLPASGPRRLEPPTDDLDGIGLR